MTENILKLFKIASDNNVRLVIEINSHYIKIRAYKSISKDTFYCENTCSEISISIEELNSICIDFSDIVSNLINNIKLR